MKYMLLKSCLVAVLPTVFIFSTSAIAWNEQFIEVGESDFQQIRTMSKNHGTPSARNISIVNVNGLPALCANGIFYNSVVDSDSHSLLLSAYITSAPFKIGYDIDQRTAPWGEAGYCALTHILLTKDFN